MLESGARYSWKSPPSSRADAKAPARSTPFNRFGGPGRQERRLDALREAHFLLEPLLRRSNFFVQPGVLDRDGGLAGEQRQDLDVALAEGVELRALEIDDADAAVLEQERNRQLRSHIGHQVDVPGILRHVGREHDFLVQRGIADQALAERHARHFDLLAVLDRQLHLQLVVVVHEQDPERAVVDDPLGELRDADEQLVDVEHRRHFVADLGERLERLRVETAALEQAGVHQRHGNVRRELRDDRHVAIGELMEVPAEDVQRADRPRPVQQRHHQLRLHAGNELDVAGIDGHVVHDQRLLARDRRAHQADARGQPDRTLGLRITDGIRQPQLPAALLEQVHGERVERDQSPDQLGDLPQQLVEVENGRDLPAKVEKSGDELAFARRRQVGRRDGRAVRWVSVTH